MTQPLFWELHSGLAHEAPGSAADTRRALALTGLAGRLRVLDVACGPGAASAALIAALPEAEVTGVDTHAPFLATAALRAPDPARFRAVEADMRALPFAPGGFELIWCEGAAYIMGVEAALKAWAPLLAPGGRIAFSEAVWLTDAPSAGARAAFAEYPAMTDAAGVRAWIAAAGFAAMGEFLVSPAGWQAYYGPLEARMQALAAAHGAGHPALAETAAEIAAWRAHGDAFGFGFFVCG